MKRSEMKGRNMKDKQKSNKAKSGEQEREWKEDTEQKKK